MSAIRTYNPNWIPSIFDDLFNNAWMPKFTEKSPAMNVMETDKEYKVEVAAPGMCKDDFSIRVNENDHLVIDMEKKSESKEPGQENNRYLRREFSHIKFHQSLALPNDVEKEEIRAKAEQGILTITLPKKSPNQEHSSMREIEIE